MKNPDTSVFFHSQGWCSWESALPVCVCVNGSLKAESVCVSGNGCSNVSGREEQDLYFLIRLTPAFALTGISSLYSYITLQDAQQRDRHTHTHMDSYLHHEFLWPIRRKKDIVNDTRKPDVVRNLQLHDAQIDNHTNIQHDSYYVLRYAVCTLIYNIRYYIPQCNVLD